MVGEKGYEKSQKYQHDMTSLKEAQSIVFSADISNEEAELLQELHLKQQTVLVCPEAKAYQHFLNTYASVSGQYLFKGKISAVLHSDLVLTFGVWLEDKRAESMSVLCDILKENKPKVVYMHPIEDRVLHSDITQFIKYEVGSEEGVAALLVQVLLKEKKLPEEIEESMEALDIGYLSAESNVGEEELDAVYELISESGAVSVIIGSDLYMHPKAEQIAKLLALLERYTPFNIVCLPPAHNALGIAMICTLAEAPSGETVGYESCKVGTYVNADKQVCTNPDIDSIEALNALGRLVGDAAEDISAYSRRLPKDKGFREISAEDVKQSCLYELELQEQQSTFVLDEIEELPVYDGAVIYTYETTDRVNEKETFKGILSGSKQFALAAKLQDGERISFVIDGVKFTRVFKIDTLMKGVIALNPTFDIKLSASLISSYRFSRLAFENTNNQKIGNNNE